MKKFVSSSGLRQIALALLEESDMKVSDLADKLGSSLQSVSRTLKELREENLIRCVTPERRSNRIYRITDKGKQVLEQIPAQTAQLRTRRFEMKVAGDLDDAGVTYAKNEKIGGERFGGRPDFIIEANGGLRLAVELKRVSKKSAMPSVKRAAFTYNDLTRGACDLKTVLIVGGTSREDELRREILKLENPEFFDRIFFEDELENFISYVKELLEE